MVQSRMANTARNAVWGFVEKFVQMVLPFVTRTLILTLLNEKYLGLNGLFTSIITTLNLADLGFGAAITYTMYKPIANNDNKALSAILNYYKKIYRSIGFLVLILGLALMPFLSHLIKGDVPADINIYLLFSIYLTNTVLSYWLFAYKKSLLHAYHRDDVQSRISVITLFLQYGLQILLLLLFDNYYLYVIVMPVITLIGNIMTAIITKHMYPDVLCKGNVEKQVVRGIKKQVGGAFIGKVCGVTRNSLSSVFISSFLGLTQVAIYSNYYYILGAVHTFMNVLTNSMVGGVGNSIVKESVEKNYKDFTKFTFLYSWVSGWFSCCLLCLYQPFMRLWVGESLMVSFPTMVLFVLYLYVMAASDIKNVYYTARGLWWEGRWRSLLEVLVNTALQYFAIKYMGIAGILISTILTMALINYLYGTSILFKHYFKGFSMFKYVIQCLCYLIVTCVVCALTYLVCSFISLTGIVRLLVIAPICILLPNILLLLVYCRTKVFAAVRPTFEQFIRRLLKKA